MDKKSAKNDVEKHKTPCLSETVELDELYWFLERKPRTETRENIYIMTMVSREPRQIVGHMVSTDKSSRTIQRMVDAALEAKRYCTDGYSGYLDVIFPGKHIFNVHNKSDTFTVEGATADLRHYIPTLARRSRCFPRKLENLRAALRLFVRVYNRFGAAKARFRILYPLSEPPFFSSRFLLSVRLDTPLLPSWLKNRSFHDKMIHRQALAGRFPSSPAFACN